MHSNRFRVYVDLPRLRANLARGDGRPASEQDAKAFLADAGFSYMRLANAFIGDKHAMAHLEADELRSFEPIAG